MPSKREEVAKAVVVTAEVLGHELSPAAAMAMARELSQHEPPDVAHALRRCQRELRGRLALSDVLSRLPGRHIGAEEAWALCPRSEDQTVVWTREIAAAFAAAYPLLREGDAVGARMAFKEAYAEMVAGAESSPQWEVSLGWDPNGRIAPVTRAVELGRLTAGDAERHIGHLPGCSEIKRIGHTQDLASLLPEGEA